MKVYLAGYETAYSSYNTVLEKNANIFCTYFYKNQTSKTLKYLTEVNHQGLVTVDSGAHSFFGLLGVSITSHANDKKKDIPDPRVYFKEYKAWLKAHYNFLDYFCELDLQDILGMDQILQWRKELEDEGLADKAITVFHRDDGWEAFEALCANSKSGYIAIEGIKKNRSILPYNKYLKYAYEHGIKVHGFAFTKADLIQQFPFYSVDSSSWTMGPRYGSFQVFRNGQMPTVTGTKAHFFKYGIPVELHNSHRSKEHSKLKLEFTAKEFQKLESYVTKLWEMRGIHWKD